MSNWNEMELGKAIQFNPTERIVKGKVAKKIPMDKLIAHEKKIKGFEFAEYSAGPKFKNGDTLVAKITPCLENGKTAQVNLLDENEVAFGSSEFIVLRQNEFTINDFIFYLAKSPAFRKRAIGCMEGTSGRKRVNEGALKLQVLPIPDKATQQKIVSVLSALDSKIELNNRINTELEAMAKTLYDYWFVQFDFPDKNGKPYKTNGGKMVWNEALKREVPEGWEVQKLKEFATTGSGGTPLSTKQEYYKNGDIPWINSGELNSIYIVQTDNYITKEGLNNSSAKIFPSDTLLIALYGATAGKVSLLKMDAATNQAVCAILLKNQSLLYYLKFALSDLYQYLINLSSGSARDNLSQDLVKELIFAKPADNLIKYFNEIVNPSIEKIVSNIQENQKLTELRDWLLPMLMNGQVQVVDEKETELLMAAEPKMEYGK